MVACFANQHGGKRERSAWDWRAAGSPRTAQGSGLEGPSISGGVRVGDAASQERTVGELLAQLAEYSPEMQVIMQQVSQTTTAALPGRAKARPE